jgi:hypothetical protein
MVSVMRLSGAFISMDKYGRKINLSILPGRKRECPQ